METIPIVDETDKIIGKEEISKVHKEGLLHREAYSYLINSKKEVLLQKRTDRLIWDTSSAGHFSIKETYLDGAKREFKEELGIDVPIKNFVEISYERIKTESKNKKNKRFIRVFLVKKDIPISNFKIDKNEVIEVKYFNLEEIKKLLENPKKLTKSANILIKKHILTLLE